MSPKPAQNRSGNAAIAVLFLLVACAGLAAYLWIGGAGTGEPGESGPVTKTAVVPADAIERESASTSRVSASEPGVRGPTARAATVTEDPKRFKGRGSLAGTVSVDPGAEMPAEWTLVLSPSRSLMGREYAVEKRFTFAGDQTEFAVDDLPLAGYDVRAEAPNMNSRPIPVLLERTSSHAYVMLDLVPAGSIAGTLLDHVGAPIEGFAVWLHEGHTEGLGMPRGKGRKALTAADGRYVFDDVLDGSYELRFGTPLNPLAGPLKLVFNGPSLTVPPPDIPPLARLLLMVVDMQNQPVAGAQLTCYGSGLGNIERTSPPDGRIAFDHLPPGNYTFTVEHELFGNARLTRRFTGGEDEVEVLVLMEEP